tara:strand:+ start:452 stop:853 length:402 start_codon:yes stop_codon:yes gene_type:complete
MQETKKIWELTDSKINPQIGAIKITDGEYQGLLYQYGEVSFHEQDDGRMQVKFKYNMLENPTDLKEDQDMMNFMGDILVELLDDQLGKGEFRSHTSLDDIDDIPDEIGNQVIREKVEQEKHRRAGEKFEEDKT